MMKFYINRLKHASIPELAYRAKQVFLIWQLRVQLKNNKMPVQATVLDPLNVKRLKLPHFEGKIEKECIEKILDGKCFCQNTDKAVLKEYEKEWSITFFANIKWSESSLDIRPLWEVARL